MVRDGQGVPINYAFQLRNWAVTPEDAMLTLEQIALHILREEENPKSTLGLIRPQTPLKRSPIHMEQFRIVIEGNLVSIKES